MRSNWQTGSHLQQRGRHTASASAQAHTKPEAAAIVTGALPGDMKAMLGGLDS